MARVSGNFSLERHELQSAFPSASMLQRQLRELRLNYTRLEYQLVWVRNDRAALSLVRGPVRRLAAACTIQGGFAARTAQHLVLCFAAVRAAGARPRSAHGHSLGVAHDGAWNSNSQQHPHCDLLALLDLCVIPKATRLSPPTFQRSVDMNMSAL
jgi:hypothetical protein